MPTRKNNNLTRLKNAGKIDKFRMENGIIAAAGSVSSSKVQRTTLENEAVERCVADQIKKIQFPAPKGDGIVIVTYPFVFMPVAASRR